MKRKPGSADPNVRALLCVLDEGFDGRAWHGPNLASALRGVGPELAVWRPGEGRHSIWELTLHAAYWKWTAVRRMGAVQGRFARRGANFPVVPDPADSEAWDRDVELLRSEHARLRAVVAAMSPADPDRRLGASGEWTVEETVRGIALHDVYHAGQIGLLKRLHEVETRR
ncbi:MAG: DinB family protein [Longimicrobiales bacterium]